MKLWLCVVVGMSVLGVSFWLIVITDAHPVPVTIFVVADAGAVVGAFWMMYVALRCEKNPWPMFWLAFIPFASLWYYFVRVRHSERLSRRRGLG